MEQHRRRTRRWLLASTLLSSALVVLAAGWWIARPGTPVDSTLGVELPRGTRLIHTEDAVARGSEFSVAYLSVTLPVSRMEADLEGRPGVARLAPHLYQLPGGVMIRVSAAREIPATRLGPIERVSPSVPLGTRAWLVVVRGSPPASTWVVSVPPYGEV